jgi:hypothetical protein
MKRYAALMILATFVLVAFAVSTVHAAERGESPKGVTQVLGCAGAGDLSVWLSCSSSCIGDKTRYACTATASGGIVTPEYPYTFSWSGASQYSDPNANPNSAYLVLVPGGPCDAWITVTVTDACGCTAQSSRHVYNYCGCVIDP